MLASTALLAHFEAGIRKNGIPTRLHVEGLAAILTSRPATYPVTQLAREIFDFHACDSAIMACIQGVPSPFERVARAYFANNRIGYSDCDRAQLKALGTELFIRIPRLVGLVRSLRLQPAPENILLLDALRLTESLLSLRDPQAEGRLLRNIKVNTSDDTGAASPLWQNLYFVSVDDFEALAYYWQNRLSLLRLEQRLHNVQPNITDEPEVHFRSSFGSRTNEMFRLMESILLCADYAETLSLRKHGRMFARAMIVVWGVIMDIRLGLIQDGEWTSTMPEQVLRSANTALAVKPDFTIEDMDNAADIFVGGQPKGRFVELYGL
ncbi:hypothetical protein B0J11DRAFT_541647 [Dendryphion nanum]|uniref:Uncharacterized protein n=1 Tax=Dendryphion nanum TaxID=256645 RepID=A0A9P9D5N1_9PLEO|nr:hypothetical protein B0J11DRAFT_541647 [Dendryphion nanum]